MSKTKKRILNTARIIFNEQGYRNVTIRMIAEKLDMSSGNLNYHFKKREDILEHLYFEMVTVFDKRVDDLPETTFSIQQIYTDIFTSMERMVEYRFFWTDMYHILQENGSIQTHFNDIYNKRKAGFIFLCRELIKTGQMLTPSFNGQYEELAETMINYGNTWIYASLLYNEELTKDKINASAKAMLQMLYPYLEDKIKAEAIKFTR